MGTKGMQLTSRFVIKTSEVSSEEKSSWLQIVDVIRFHHPRNYPVCKRRARCSRKSKKKLRVIIMVCVPCIVIPVLLYIWHRWLQPIALKIWNPWGKVETDKKTGEGTGTAGAVDGATNGLPPGHSPEKINGGSCPFASTSKSSEELKKTE